MAANRQLLETGEYSDLTVRCGVREWRVHRSIICKRSKFFATASDGGFKVSVMPSRRLSLPNSGRTWSQRKSVCRTTIRACSSVYSTTCTCLIMTTRYRLVRYESFSSRIYDTECGSTDYSASSSGPGEISTSSASAHHPTTAMAALRLNGDGTQGSTVDVDPILKRLLTNAQVYAMADKFGVPDLKLLAQEKFLRHTDEWPIPGFAAVVHEILASTPQSDRGLRVVVRDILAVHVEEITSIPGSDDATQYTPESLRARRKWMSILTQEGEFLLEILNQVVAQNAKQTEKWISNQTARESDFRDYQTRVKTLEKENQREITQIRAEKDNEIKSLRQENQNIVQRGSGLVAALTRHNHCGNCHERFQPIMLDLAKHTDWVKHGTLRCKLCRTRHDWSQSP